MAGLSLAMVFLPASIALAVPIVNIGTYQAESGSLVDVTVTVSGGDPIAGVNFTIGAGPFSVTPGNPETGSLGPTISNLDVHWLFVGNDGGQVGPTSFLGGRK